MTELSVIDCVECNSFGESGLDGARGWCHLAKKWLPLSSSIPEWCPLSRKKEAVSSD